MDATAASQGSDSDPFAQQFDFTRSDGETFGVPVEQIDDLRIYTATLATTYGAQFGATFTLLLVLLLLTRADKRKSSMFIINASCLAANAIRCILLSCFTTSTLMNPFVQLTGEFSHVTKRDLATTVTSSIFSIIVMSLVMISLSMQTWVVCITTAPIERYIIMGLTTVVALVAVGYKAAFVVLNVRDTLNFVWPPVDRRFYQDSYIVQAASIWFFSSIFTYKLGHAIHQRRKLKMPQFGPMQIVFIMGCQTMLIPAIFTCLQLRKDTVELGPVVLTTVCIFLPFSAIWAGVINETAVPTGGRRSARELVQSEFVRTGPTSTMDGSSSTTMMDKSRQLSVCTYAAQYNGMDGTTGTPTRKKSVPEYEEDGIHIGREFGFSRSDASDHV